MRDSVAREAVDAVAGARNDSYGDPSVNLTRIAKMWGAYLDCDITASDVAKMMTIVKLSRSRHRYTRDNYVDGVAYLLLAEETDHGRTD